MFNILTRLMFLISNGHVISRSVRTATKIDNAYLLHSSSTCPLSIPLRIDILDTLVKLRSISFEHAKFSRNDLIFFAFQASIFTSMSRSLRKISGVSCHHHSNRKMERISELSNIKCFIYISLTLQEQGLIIFPISDDFWQVCETGKVLPTRWWPTVTLRAPESNAENRSQSMANPHCPMREHLSLLLLS